MAKYQSGIKALRAAMRQKAYLIAAKAA